MQEASIETGATAVVGCRRTVTLAAGVSLAALAIASLTGCAGESAPSGFGLVRVALVDEASCAEHCAQSYQAQLLRSADDTVGFAPASAPTECGQPLVLEGAPAGAILVVKAWVSDGVDNLFVGTSEPVTVAADAEVTASVQLEPLDPPVITSISPEPVVLDAGGAAQQVTISGEGFRFGAGLAALEVDGVTWTVDDDDWGYDSLVAEVSGDVSGGTARVVTCGMASEPATLRVIGAQPGSHDFQLGECDGAVVTDVAALAEDRVVLAVACSDAQGAGLLLEVELTPGSCSKAISPVWLDGTPVGLAIPPDSDEAWVALSAPDRLVRVSLADGDTTASHDLAAPPLARALVADESAAYLGLDAAAEQVLRVTSDAAERLDAAAGLSLRDVALSGGRLLLLTSPARLVLLEEPLASSPMEVHRSLDACAEPVALAVGGDGRFAVVSCAGDAPQVAAVSLDEEGGMGEPASILLDAAVLPGDVTLDAAGDVAFVWDRSAGAIEVVSAAAAGHLRSWGWPTGSGTDAVLLAMGSPDRLVLGGLETASATVVRPFGSADPCDDDGGSE